MKKSAALAAVLVLCASQAWAYENTHAGYSVKDKDPFFKIESQKSYAYSGFSSKSLQKIEEMQQGSVHMVHYFTAEEMEQVIGEKFSTAYFDKEYDKLALLERSELNMQTVPCALLDLTKYEGISTDKTVPMRDQQLKKQWDKLKPTIDVSKFNGKKGIYIAYLYKQGENLVSMQTTLTSANDRLYMLTTLTYNAPEQKEEAATTEETVSTGAEATTEQEALEITVSAIEAAMTIENVDPKDADAAELKKMHKNHQQLLKGFKTTAPVKAPHILSYHDAITGKTMTLPQDWVYGQMLVNEKEGSGNVAFAAPMSSMQKMADAMDYQELFDVSSYTAGQGLADDKIFEAGRLWLDNFDALLVTGSFKIKDADLQALLATPAANKLEADMFLREGLQRLKSMGNEYATLDSYDYSLNFTKEKSIIDINGIVTILKDYKLSNNLSLGLKKDIGTILWYTEKLGYDEPTQLAEQIKQWQF